MSPEVNTGLKINQKPNKPMRRRMGSVLSCLALGVASGACGVTGSEPLQSNPNQTSTTAKTPELTLKNNLCQFISKSQVKQLLGVTAVPPAAGVLDFGSQNCVQEQAQTGGNQGIYAKTPDQFFNNPGISGAVWSGNDLNGTLLIQDSPNTETYTPKTLLKPSSDPSTVGHYAAIGDVAGYPAYQFVAGFDNGKLGALESNNLPSEMVVISPNTENVKIFVFNKIIYPANHYSTDIQTQTTISTEQAINIEKTIASELIPADLVH
ncbi:MAG: hypothetical protein ACRDFS_11180 [Chloroflexota bacterium]